MATRIPRWSQLRPAGLSRPLTAAERREYHALRLGLLLAIGMLQNGVFTPEHQPISGDFEDQFDWLRHNLRPLVRGSPTIALAVRLLHLDGPAIAWSEPAVLGRHLRRMADEAGRLGTTLRTARRRNYGGPA